MPRRVDWGRWRGDGETTLAQSTPLVTCQLGHESGLLPLVTILGCRIQLRSKQLIELLSLDSIFSSEMHNEAVEDVAKSQLGLIILSTQWPRRNRTDILALPQENPGETGFR